MTDLNPEANIARLKYLEGTPRLSWWQCVRRIFKMSDDKNSIPPVDRKARSLADGSPVTPDHREIDPSTGMQKAYVVLSDEERAKGFVRPYRDSYVHEKCRGLTRMGWRIAETYARDPFFYSGTFCVGCGAHFPVGENGEFVWDKTNIKVGT